MCSLRLLPGVLYLLVTCGPHRAASTSSPCISGGSRQNKSDTVLKIARHDWLSHNIVSSIAEIVLGEILGYSIQQVRPLSTTTWGPDIAAGLYDIDAEQWNVGSNDPQYWQYVSSAKQVLDAGLLGYAGQSGLYTMRAMVDKDPMADYYKLYQNGSRALQLGFPSFRDSQLRVSLGSDFPHCCCNLSWCGVGDFQGYWAPSICQASPDNCFEIMKPSVTADQGYFEQVIQHNSVMGVFGYYGWDLEDKLRSMQGQSVIFYWWEPTLLIFQLDVVRISFPDHSFGCDLNNTENPDTGDVSCDHIEVSLRKIVSQRVRDVAPEVYYFMYNLLVEPHHIRSLVLATGTNQTIEEVACSYVQASAITSLPSCIMDPVSVDLGDGMLRVERFNEMTLECENVTELPRLPPYRCFPPELRPGQVDRSEQVILLSHKTWLSHTLVASVTEILLSEYLGLNVINVYSPMSSAVWGEQMSEGLYEVDMENWWVRPANRKYLDSGRVHLAGSIGYPGRDGLYIATKALERSDLVDYYKFYLNATHAAHLGFATHSESNLREVTGSSFPLCVDFPWCGTGELEGYWASPGCESEPGRCLQILSGLPIWTTGHFEQLASNLGLEVVCGYYGHSRGEALTRYEAVGLLAPFFAFEPDAWLSTLDVVRISFPDYTVGCLSGDTNEPSGPVTCDFPPMILAKLVTDRVAESLREARAVIHAIELLEADLNSMFALHVDAGGTLHSPGDVACEFIKRNDAKVRAWAPDCLVKPPRPEHTRINDSWFSRADGECIQLACPQDRILTWVEALRGFECTPCREGEVPDELQLSCNPCAAGQEAILDDASGILECHLCAPGRYSLLESSACSPCESGSYADMQGESSCKLCPIGRSQAMLGSTVCEECSAGQFAFEPASSACAQCFSGYYQDDASATACDPCPQGTFAAVPGSTTCEECAFGTTLTAAANAGSDCQCPVGTFLLNSSLMKQCVGCDADYMEPCLGGDHPAWQKSGFYITPDGANVYRCASDRACPSDILGRCPMGSHGKGCADCADGEYVWDGERCEECSTMDGFAVVILPLLFVVAFALVFKYGNDPIGHKLTLFSEFLVLVGLTTNIFLYMNSFAGIDVDWEEPVRTIFEVCKYLLREATRFHLSCSVSFSEVESYAFTCLMPFGVAVLLGLLAAFGLVAGQKVFNTLATLTYALYLVLLLHGLGPFRYIVHPNGSKSVLDMPTVFEGSEEHAGLVMFGLLLLLFYCLPFAAACCFASYRIGRTNSNTKRRWWLTTFRFLFYKFHPEFYFWGVVTLLRNACFALAPSLAPEVPKVSLFVLSFAASSCVAATSLASPWRHTWMTIVDVMILCYILLVLNLASGWVRVDDGADSFVANLLVTIGVIAIIMGCSFALKLLVSISCASREELQSERSKITATEEKYNEKYLVVLKNSWHTRQVAYAQLFGDPKLEIADGYDMLTLDMKASSRVFARLPRPLLAISREETAVVHLADMAASIGDPSYSLLHFYEDCCKAFPELKLYDLDDLEPGQDRLVGGRTRAEEQQRTIGALFAVYALCRLDTDGKEVMSFGVDPDRSFRVNGPPADVQREALKDIPWPRMTPDQRRANFYWNFNWELMQDLFVQAGILCIGSNGKLVLDAAPDGRLVAMLSLTAYHDIMKDPCLCPTVLGEPYEAYQVGEIIQDHDMALAYVLDRHADVLPSFRILTEAQQKLIRFTQSEMGFNAGWLVQAEGPPSAVLRKLKVAIQTGGAKESDVAFYFVHWVTDLAGAEPTPFTGSEKFAAKFPPFVLQGLLGCFASVKMLADHSETEVYEAYLRQRWQAAYKGDGRTQAPGEVGANNEPLGEHAIARMRLLCMAQGGATSILEAFERLPDAEKGYLSCELAATGLPGQKYSGLAPHQGVEAGTPFLLYYGPAWCQRVAQSDPDLALRILSAVFRLGREAFPESSDMAEDQKNGITYRTLQLGVLKTTELELLRQVSDTPDDDVIYASESQPNLVVRRDTRLEGSLRDIQAYFI